MIKTFTAVENSTIYDVCLSTYGSLNFIGKLMDDNDHAGVDLYPTTGQVFSFDSNLVQSPVSANINVTVSGGASQIKYATRPQ